MIKALIKFVVVVAGYLLLLSASAIFFSIYILKLDTSIEIFSVEDWVVTINEGETSYNLFENIHVLGLLVPAIIFGILLFALTFKDNIPFFKKTKNKWLISAGLLGLLVAVGLSSNLIPTEDAPLISNMIKNNGLALVMLTVGIIVPITEELLFRKFAINQLQKILNNPIASIAISSVLFALFHMQYNLAMLLIILIIGVLLALMRYYSNTLILPILAHMFFNTVAVLGNV